ncbi:MAG: recombination mediator RecR [Myxococcota bacterium]|nr:recombination mediator RecR [Myxococcota bacterium]
MSQDPIRRCVEALSRLPGIGEKTAQRLTWWLLRAPDGAAEEIAEAVASLQGSVMECETCCNIGTSNPCRICADHSRDPGTICVVERPPDVQAIEVSGEFRGQYHVLHGALSPLDGVGPDDLRIRELLARIPQTEEVILATDPDIDGDTTALYLARLLAPLEVRVSRLAHGIAVGTEIEYADKVSLMRALENRRTLPGTG